MADQLFMRRDADGALFSWDEQSARENNKHGGFTVGTYDPKTKKFTPTVKRASPVVSAADIEAAVIAALTPISVELGMEPDGSLDAADMQAMIIGMIQSADAVDRDELITPPESPDKGKEEPTRGTVDEQATTAVDLEAMDKDALLDYASNVYGESLNRTFGEKRLREEVQKLIEADSGE